MKNFVAISTCIFVLAACATNNIQYYTKIDPSQKTITVPPGGAGLKGELKQVLAGNNWKMVVYGGPDVTEGNVGKTTTIKQYQTFNSRYTLYSDVNAYDSCLNFEPLIKYEISLVDNKFGSEVFTMNGDDCSSLVVKKFETAIQNAQRK